MSITLRNVTKDYRTRAGWNPILKNVSLHIEKGEHLGILGQNGAGKSTLIRVLSGSERPTTGEVDRQMSVSWPLAFGGAFLGALTGIDNVRFVCRLYGVDPDEKMAFVEEFTELGRYLREPVRSYSSGMRARLAFAVSMAIDFDCYLIDEIVAVGDDRFQRKCQVELFEKRRDKAMLLVSHSPDYIRVHCDRASVLAAGSLTNFDSVDEAYAFYSSHELAMQPHMAQSSAGADEPPAPVVQLDHDLLERIIDFHATHPTPEDFDDFLLSLQISEASVFDCCDLVGRLSRAGSPAAAESVARFLTAQRPSEALYWITLGDMLCQRRQHVPGVKAYHKALQIDPDSYWGNRNLAVEHFNVGRYEDAIPYFDKSTALAADPMAAVELQLRSVDCRTLLDLPVASQAVEAVSRSAPVIVVDRSLAVLSDGSAARISVAGLAIGSLDLSAIRCTIRAGERSWEAWPSFARNSLRRLAAVSDTQAFAFTSYVPLPPGMDSVEVELTVGGLRLFIDRTHGQTMTAAVGGGESLLERARLANAEHRADVSALLYGRSAQEDGAYDIVPFAENLIAVGLYDEAEYWLRRWRETHGPDHEDRGHVLDLLGVELARSRLPGWREEICRMVNSEHQAKKSASTLANLGHLRVSEGDIAGAITLYREAAANREAEPLIHFARGIHTAQWAAKCDAPTIRQVSSEPEEGAGEAVAEIVHLFACDARYFVRFGRTLVQSSQKAARGTQVICHAHIVDPDEESSALAEKLARDFGLRITSEISPATIQDEQIRRAYFTCARFLIAPRLLSEYRCPILITETDCLVNWSWRDILEYIGDADVGEVKSALWNWVPWTKVPAGIFLFAPTAIGRAWADFIVRFIRHAFEREGSGSSDLWTVDQVALWLSNTVAPEGHRTVHLPMASVLTLATGDKNNILEAA